MFPWDERLRWLVRGKVAGMRCALRPERDAYKLICAGLGGCGP